MAKFTTDSLNLQGLADAIISVADDLDNHFSIDTLAAVLAALEGA